MTKKLVGLFFSFIISVNVFAGLPVGKVLENYMTRNIVINDKDIKSEQKIFWGDKIKTNHNNSGDVLIFPSLVIKIKPNSEIKVVGSLMSNENSRPDSKTDTKTILKVIKGGIVANLYKEENNDNNLKVIGKRSISSIRGTIFEVDVEQDNETTVFEGNVVVNIPLLKKEVDVNSNESLNVASGTVLKKSLIIPEFISKSEVKKLWEQDASEILELHKKDASKYKKLLDLETKKISTGLNNSAKSMFNNIRGVYDAKK
jgi:hypothetical protein